LCVSNIIYFFTNEFQVIVISFLWGQSLV